MLIVAYVIFVVYAASLFVYAVARDRNRAAIGILLSLTGLQFVVLETLSPIVAIAVAAVGLALVARDLFEVLMPRLALALVQRRSVQGS